MVNTALIVIYNTGIMACSVCVPKELTKEEIEEGLNSKSPTGIDSKWRISKDTHFKDGIHTNPCTCDMFFSERLHYLMEC